MLDCSQNTDNEIVSKMSSGDIDAFYCIVEKYEHKLLKYILRITNVSHEEAENILQEVFIKVYIKINSYNFDYSFSSWIYRITHNYTIDYYKKNSKREILNIEGDDENINFLDLFESDENIEKDIFSKELNKKIGEIINFLDIKYKEVLILKFLEEKNYKEISDILKIPEGTVATLINRGKKQFKQKAEEQNLINYL